MKKIVFLPAALSILTGCTMVQDQRHAMTTKEGSWQQYTQSIPVVALPAGMRTGALQSFYHIPPVKAIKHQPPPQVEGVFLPPQVQ